MPTSADPKTVRDFVKAVKHGTAEAVNAYLEADATLATMAEADGTTPLHHAAWKGHAAVCGLLLDRGAAVNALNTNEHYGGTPLHAAAHCNQKPAAEVLLQRGADLNVRSSNGRTPLEETELHNASAVRNLLRRLGAEG
jgi:ankyrin repeat protein